MDLPVTIVSGLPRSGTSMMMRMLEAGGMEVVVDHIREADTDNPGGYYEFEPVKKLKQDKSWVDAIRGKAVKIIYKHVYDLPVECRYRILFMQRDVKEVIASQNKMMERSGVGSDGFDSDRLADLFRAEVKAFFEWAKAQEHIDLLAVDYSKMVADGGATIDTIVTFLGEELDTEAMVHVVDPNLYRNRKTA